MTEGGCHRMTEGGAQNDRGGGGEVVPVPTGKKAREEWREELFVEVVGGGFSTL